MDQLPAAPLHMASALVSFWCHQGLIHIELEFAPIPLSQVFAIM